MVERAGEDYAVVETTGEDYAVVDTTGGGFGADSYSIRDIRKRG